MKKSTQARIAGWTGAIGFASIVFPLAAIIAFVEMKSKTELWAKCIGIILLGCLTIWTMDRIEKEKIIRPILGWIVCLAYFAFVPILVAYELESFSLAAIFTFPEFIGVALSLIGLIHALKNQNRQLNNHA